MRDAFDLMRSYLERLTRTGPVVVDKTEGSRPSRHGNSGPCPYPPLWLDAGRGDRQLWLAVPLRFYLAIGTVHDPGPK